MSYSAALEWRSCATPQTPADLQCATLNVPLDWSRPDGPRIDLAVNRTPARGDRIGSLLVNPGGPGGSAVDVVAYNGMVAGYPEGEVLAERFDLVGLDPRGVGHSSPVRCDPATLHDPAVSRFGDFDRLVVANRRAGQDCLDRTGPLLGHVDTISVAKDMEALRRALGEERISYYGMSYGTEIGELYADLFPGRVRSMVLDAPVDHALPTLIAARDEAAAIEDSANRFFATCMDSMDCAARFDRLLTRPDAEDLTDGFYGYLTMKAAWPQLAQALAAADAGDPGPLLQGARFNSGEYGAYRAVSCQDFPAVMTAEVHRRWAEELRRVAPRTWRYSEFWEMATGCAGWGMSPRNPPSYRWITGTPSVLVIGGTHDPATPLRWAESLSARIDGSRLLVDERDGHAALLHSPCARQRAAEYLVSGSLPEIGAVCREQPADPVR
ncbi:alpha/beta hydrolase [Amycolatopsis lurida]